MNAEQLETRIHTLNQVLDQEASNLGMERNEFLESIGNVDKDVAYRMISVLEERIRLLRSLWKIRIQEEHPGADNVLLFLRSKV
jgi:hypothetical protein